jgi:hypothetical protein
LATVSGCSSLSTVRSEADAIGTFRLSAIFGTYDIDLRPDHTCIMSSRTAYNRQPKEGTWEFRAGVVTISLSDTKSVAFQLEAVGSEVVLTSESGRAHYVRLAKNEPNKASDSTRQPVPPPAAGQPSRRS